MGRTDATERAEDVPVRRVEMPAGRLEGRGRELDEVEPAWWEEGDFEEDERSW